MQYEASGRTGPRRPVGVILLPLLGFVLVLAAWLGGSPNAGGDDDPARGAASPPAVARGSPQPLMTEPPPVRWIDCADFPAADCGRAVDAAQLALGDGVPPVVSAALSRSLICGDDLDCPRWFLRNTRTVGSVVLTFADSTVEVWVNVVDPESGGEDETRTPFVGRIARWVDRG